MFFFKRAGNEAASSAVRPCERHCRAGRPRGPEQLRAQRRGRHLTRRLRAPRAPSEALEKQLLSAPCRLCFCGSAGRGGESTCGEGPPTPWRRYLARRTPGRPHLGQRGFPAPPCRRAPRAAGCRHREAPCWPRPATCRRPRGRSWRCPSLPGREPITPSSGRGGGRHPRRGLESSDYLIAADTKPIFLPLKIPSIVTAIFTTGPSYSSTRATFPRFFESLPKEQGRVAHWLHANKPLLLPTPLCSVPSSFPLFLNTH